MNATKIKISGIKKVVSQLKNVQSGTICLDGTTGILDIVDGVDMKTWEVTTVFHDGSCRIFYCIGNYNRLRDGQPNIKMINEMLAASPFSKRFSF